MYLSVCTRSIAEYIARRDLKIYVQKQVRIFWNINGFMFVDLWVILMTRMKWNLKLELLGRYVNLICIIDFGFENNFFFHICIYFIHFLIKY